jgi:mutator protein MutT
MADVCIRVRACGIIYRAGRLLLQRKSTDEVWALPGGKLEPGETPEAALAREFREELGWQVLVGERLCVLENSFTQDGVEIRQTEFCFTVTCDAPLCVKDKTLEFRWVSPEELGTLDVRPKQMRMYLFQIE